MALTRKHYEQFAKLLGGYAARDKSVYTSELIGHLERIFEEDNSQFDHQAFEMAVLRERSRR